MTAADNLIVLETVTACFKLFVDAKEARRIKFSARMSDFGLLLIADHIVRIVEAHGKYTALQSNPDTLKQACRQLIDRVANRTAEEGVGNKLTTQDIKDLCKKWLPGPPTPPPGPYLGIRPLELLSLDDDE